MRRARGSAARQCRARVMDDARRGENEVEAGTRTTVEYDDASDGESFGAFATPARAFADGTTEDDETTTTTTTTISGISRRRRRR